MADLMTALPPERFVTDPEAIAGYLHDDAEWAPHGTPVAVVRPQSTAEVQAVVAYARDHGLAIVPRGAGTGLSGGANAVAGSIVVSLERMDQVLEIDAAERLAVVQPGIVTDTLRAAAAEHRLWYPPDPASSPWSTIGGNVATNAGGVCCVKYGVTGDYVLGLEMVTPDAQVVRLGRRTAKGVAGYDLCSLMVGSEGTLGIITEVTLRLRPPQGETRTVAGHFASVQDAGRAVGLVTAAGIVPSAMELIDRYCLQAVDTWKNLGLSLTAEVVLLGQTDAPDAAGQREAEEMLRCFAEAGATHAAQSRDAQEADTLFAARRLAYPALERLGPLLTEDVCVPVTVLPQMLTRIQESARRHDIHIATIAHAGDGNLHPLLVTDPDDEPATWRAREAFEEIHSAAIELGGTVTGEHGVGLMKAPGLTRELSPAVVDMHLAIKRALDPRGLMNPGKALPLV